MIDIGSWDQENFEKKNCGQCPQQIRNYPPTSGFNPGLNLQNHQFHSRLRECTRWEARSIPKLKQDLSSVPLPLQNRT